MPSSYFSAVRSALGMTIYPFDQSHLIEILSADILNNKKTVALVCDRCFSPRGIRASWPGSKEKLTVKLPAGPFVIAQRTKSVIVPVTCSFDRRWVKVRMKISVHDPIEIGENEHDLSDAADRLTAVFAQAIADHPSDWHMLRHYFDEKR